MPPTILLIAPESAATPITEALRHDLRADVETTSSRRSALASLRRREFDLILIEESLATTDADLVYQHAAGALVLELNLALSGAPRIVRQARAALTRRTHEQARARSAAATTLQHELNAALAAILLESEMALRDATPLQTPRLRHLVQLASDLRDRLRA